MRINEWQFLRESTPTVFAFETTSHEMQERFFAPHIPVADAPMFFLVHCRGKGAAMGAQCNLFSMSTPKMEDFMLPFSTDCEHPDHQSGYTQQFGQRFVQNFFEFSSADSFHSLGGILDERNNVGQQFHGKTS
jgi:hypothetical protein